MSPPKTNNRNPSFNHFWVMVSSILVGDYPTGCELGPVSADQFSLVKFLGSFSLYFFFSFNVACTSQYAPAPHSHVLGGSSIQCHVLSGL